MNQDLFNAWKSRWTSSLLDPFILQILSTNPSWGGKLLEYARDIIDPDVRVPTIYSCLSRLQENGVIAKLTSVEEQGVTRGKARKIYEITETGQRYLNLIQEQLQKNMDILDPKKQNIWRNNL